MAETSTRPAALVVMAHVVRHALHDAETAAQKSGEARKDAEAARLAHARMTEAAAAEKAAEAAIKERVVREIEAGLATFTGLPHRSQHLRDRRGVAFVNDSKATNVDSALKALQAFQSIRWICGGLEKEGGLAGLKPGLPNVIKAYVIGREAAQFAMQLEGVEAQVCTTMAAAVKARKPCCGRTDQLKMMVGSEV